MQNRYNVGAILCAFAAITWGAMFPIMNAALHFINPYTFTAIRYSLVAIIFAAVLMWREGPSALQLSGRGFCIWGFGSLGFAGFGCLVFKGQSMAGEAGAVTASVVMALMPMLSIVFNWIFGKSRPRPASLWCVCMSLCGTLCVATHGHIATLAMLKSEVLPCLVLLAGASCWVVYTMGGAIHKDWSPLRYTSLTTLLSLPTIWLVNACLWVFGAISAPTIHQVVLVGPAMLYMVIVTGLLGVFAWNIGNKIVTPLNGVLFMDLVPVTTVIISIMRGYRFSVLEIAGASLTVTALVLNNLIQRASTQKPQSK